MEVIRFMLIHVRNPAAARAEPKMPDIGVRTQTRSYIIYKHEYFVYQVNYRTNWTLTRYVRH
jgi:hypothetical protein